MPRELVLTLGKLCLYGHFEDEDSQITSVYLVIVFFFNNKMNISCNYLFMGVFYNYFCYCLCTFQPNPTVAKVGRNNSFQ